MKEANIQRHIMLEASKSGTTVWRNNVGKGWVSPPNMTIRATKTLPVILDPGDVLLRQPYRLTWGLAPGSSDLIGIRPVVITPDMVGTTIGVFTALEVKAAKGKPTKAQTIFIEHIKAQGGIAAVVRSIADIP